MLHRIYPWKLFKDIEDMILDRRTGPSAVPDPIHRPPSAPSHTLGENAPLGSDSLTPATKPLPDHLQTEDVQIPRPRSAPGVTPPCNIVPSVMDQHPGPPHYPPVVSISTFEGAKDFTLNNSLINNVAGNFNQTIFKIDGNAEKLKNLFLAGIGPAPEFVDQVKKYILAQCIRDLPRAKAAYDDYDKSRRVSCFQGTRQALLSDIGEWIFAATEFLVYVLSGLAGIGKSTVAQTISERAAKVGILGGSFFFSRNEYDRRSAEKFVTTIAFQLCVYNKEFAEAIGKALAEGQGAAVTTKNPEQQLEVLILEPLRDLAKARPRPVVIVVDALDECNDEDVPSILRVLTLLVQALPSFKVILTTRPQPHIPVSPEVQQVFYLQDIEDKIVYSDIRLYLRHSLSWEEANRRLDLRKPWRAGDEEIETLVRGAGALFIIASTSVLFILDTKVRNPASQMKKLRGAFDQNRTPLNALNGFYTVILRGALPVDSDPDTVERFQVVIGTVVLAQDPIPVEPLAKLIGLNSEDVCAVLDNLQPVISLSDGGETPHVYHKSFPDFITDPTRCKDHDLCIIPKDHHTRIAMRCFQAMNMHLKHNIAGLDLSAPERFMKNEEGLAANDITEAQLGERIPLELRYACIHWANHLESADTRDTDLIEELELFGNEHLLHWFEALSWICKLDLAPRAVDVSLKLLKSSSAGIRNIFYDARRFISRCYAIIERSALHTYYSALPFTPTKSRLYHKYHKDMLHNLCELDGVAEQWDAMIASATVGNIDRIAFSADSSQLASWTKQELKLWDAASGTPVKTFKNAKIAITEDFSVIALSEESTVALRRVATDAPITTLSHTMKANSIAVSCGGTRIAAGLSDDTVSLWDSSQDDVMGSLGGCRGQLGFSPSGYRLASMSTEGGIKLWDGATGGFIANLDCGSEWQVVFAFSRTGSRLASVAEAEGFVYRLRLWNSENGELIGTAEDVGDKVAISDDGSFIATAKLLGSKLKLWSGDSLSLIDTLENGKLIYSLAFSLDLLAIGFDSSVMLYDLKSHTFVASLSFPYAHSLSFSPDGTRLAAASARTLQFWDVPGLKAHKNQFAPATALAFSPDCSRLASGSDDGTITLWDTCRPCQPIATQEQHSKWISTLAFSPDGGRFASGSGGGSVQFWDGRDGVPIGTLHSFHSPLMAVAFSSSLLAAATASAITLFNRETLCVIHTLDQGSRSLSFSPDGSLLASAYNNHDFYTSVVTVWAIGDRTLTSEFHVNSRTDRLIFSPDGSRLAALSDHHDGDFKFFDVDKKCSIQRIGHEDLNWVPHLNETLISRKYDNDHGDRLLGRFIDHSDPFPVLWIPVDVSKIAVGSSIFALGTSDGRVLIGRAPTSLMH